uniref:Uncharacterized protein n=1 Tax=Nelumbo nucifera TaxID=4432 RepID=A0A822ZHG4_NELNU|nr:TPA_asm: hypothetical protein HUJ06_002557 [Nelumbo nucifera]
MALVITPSGLYCGEICKASISSPSNYMDGSIQGTLIV